MEGFTLAIAAFMGISLAAASGFRVFLPPFLMALSVRSGIVDIDLIGTNFEFFTTTPAIILLGIAMLAEFAAYYLPFIDNLLDTIATPAAVIAGVGMTAISLEERASNSVGNSDRCRRRDVSDNSDSHSRGKRN